MITFFAIIGAVFVIGGAALGIVLLVGNKLYKDQSSGKGDFVP